MGEAKRRELAAKSQAMEAMVVDTPGGTLGLGQSAPGCHPAPRRQGRYGQASEIAVVVAFLASDDAYYITGETVYVDGGRRVLNYVAPVKA